MSADHALLSLSRIRCTEEVCPRRVGEVLAMIRRRQAWTDPICIEGTIGALLDGHHRFAAARLLGLTRVPVRIFDYAEVELTSWRPEFLPTRDEVLARAQSGRLFPFKTTRHVFKDRFMPPLPLADLLGHTDDMATAENVVGSPLRAQRSNPGGPQKTMGLAARHPWVASPSARNDEFCKSPR